MHLKKSMALLFAAALSLTACDEDNPFNPVPTGTLRVMNAISNSNPIDTEIEGVPTDINDIAFGSASGERDIPEGNYRVTMTTNTTGTSDISFTDDAADVDDEMVTVLYATGEIGGTSPRNPSIFQVQSNDTDLSSSQAEVQFVNVAEGQSTSLDIYLTAPTAALAAETPDATLGFRSNSGQTIITPGSYRLRITPAGNKTTVLYDSGAAGFTIPNGEAQQYAIFDNTNATVTSPLTVLVLTGDGGSHPQPHTP